MSDIQFPKESSDEKKGLLKNRKIKFSFYQKSYLNNNLTKALGGVTNTAVATVKSLELEEGVSATSATAAKASSIGNLHSTITLPLPNTLRDSQNHSWSVKEGLIGTIVNSLTGESIGSMISSDDSSKNPSGSGRKNIIDRVIGGAQKQVSNRLRNVSVDQMLGSVSAMSGLRKPLGDPGYFQNYTGSSPREFTMSWDLMPKNAGDAKIILDIIKSFKYHASPSVGVPGVTLQAPNFLTLEISNKHLEEMISPGIMVIKDISVDYAPDGSFNLYSSTEGGGFPKMINLSLSLADLKMRTSEDYRVL
jgi:hypothetical protein